ncbi:MAG TPA: dihydrodipicolinate synthase family protein [Bryobacteraceae bacterium]|nr:dihydrodipicolinate synthase family protein [Bryobacteraceae bacterium]
MPLVKPFTGILPAMQLPYRADLSIDEEELRRFAGWLAKHEGIGGLVTNGHTGEVFALSPKERAEATRIVADEVRGSNIPVISGICCEGVDEAAEHAQMAEEAGAQGLLVMPPHYWLRFGMQPQHVVNHFQTIAKAVSINLIVHIYPAWTKAAYSSELLAELANTPGVTTMKIGTREMSKYDRDLAAVRAANPAITMLTCHDEYLLTSLVQGLDGALVGFASFIPDVIVDLYKAVCDGDLKRAQSIQAKINPLKEVVYASGEPSGDAHARMKTAMMLAGRLKSNLTRPPVTAPSGAMLERIEKAVRAANLTPAAHLTPALS